MQTRPYDGKDGRKVWLNRDERDELLSRVPDGKPRRRIALQLALNGLRTDELVDVQPRDLRSLSDDHDILTVRDGKTGKREVPIADDTGTRIQYLGLNQREAVIDVGKRTVRNWIDEYRDVDDLGMHDLRRTWATDTYYSLAFEGVPIAEQLVMSWGGWKQTATGRETFRENYLGPVPDHITERSLGLLDR
jgi:integrase